MPAEHRLSPLASAALFGKHPGHGDFIAVNMPDDFGRVLSDWLGATLGEVREMMGENWESVLHSHVGLRFWIGSAVAGGLAWRGAMRMSGDRVGRRYPLIVMQPTAPDSLPVVATAQDFYISAEAMLSDLLTRPALPVTEIGEELTLRLAEFAPETDAVAEHMFWAVKPNADIETLATEVALTDLISAATGRSYWWFANELAQQSGILAGRDLPGAQAMAWLLQGGVDHAAQWQEGA